MERPYCSLLDVVDDLEIDGVRSLDKLTRFIEAASQVIDKRGQFVPLTETRRFDGTGSPTLWIDELLSVTRLTYNGVTLNPADYVLRPTRRHWPHGPYTSIELTNQGVWAKTVPNIVTIEGVWGLYSDTLDVGATATQDTNNTTTLTVSTASAISPGCVLLLGTEQEIVTAYDAPADFNLTLSDDLDTVQPDFNISDGNAVSVGEIFRIDSEQFRVLDITDDTALTVRGWNGTTRAAHDANTDLDVYRTFKVARAVNGTTLADHNGVDVLRVVPPADVRYLCEQIAALMLKKAQGGFAGKTGNVELGEVFYQDEFPSDPLKTIMTNYRIVTI